MIFHILKKDLKRKRTTNLVLLCFIIMATTFLAASTANMITITGAVDYYMDTANVSDYLVIMLSDSGESPLDAFLQESSCVEEYEVQDAYMLMEESVSIIACAEDPGRRVYDKKNSVMLQAVPEKFSKIFDEEDAPVVLMPGEIAVSQQQAVINHLNKGDRLQVDCQGKSMTFTVRAIVKDAVFGSDMISVKRLFVCREDYETLTDVTGRTHTLFYQINCSDADTFRGEYTGQQFPSVICLEKSALKMCYFFNLLMAGIMVIVGICLILISLLILRFTIVFTIQEDNKEIGIMKATGISDGTMKGIYLLKYFVMAVAGALTGLLLSFPFERLLLFWAVQNLMVPPVGRNALVNVLCAVSVIAFVILFCYGCVGRIRNYTAMEALRNGENGERYDGGCRMRLYKCGKLRPFFYLACNDVFRQMKRYLILAVIFCIGTMEILLPLMAVNTLKDEGIIRMLSVQPSSFFVDTGKTEQYIAQKDDTLLCADRKAIEETLLEQGWDAQVWIELGFHFPCHGESKESFADPMTYIMQQSGREEDDYDVLEGSVPVLENEIMVTEKTAKELDVSIGDHVYLQLPEGEKAFLVTGTYQSMMNMGHGLRVSKNASLPWQVSSLMPFQIKLSENLQADELKAAVEAAFPDYRIKTAGEWAEISVGVTGQLDSLQLSVTVLVLLINVLITVLMVKTLISRERGEIAMLKSLGFSEAAVRGWQSARILVVLSAAILAGTILSAFLGPVTVGTVFSVMGATSIHLVTDPLEVFLLYPLLLLAVTGTAAYLCAAGVRKVNLKEINSIE